MVTKTTLINCPHCGRRLNAVGDMMPDDMKGSVPGPGDVTLCIGCGAAMVITEGLGLRAATPEENACFDGDPEIQQTRRAIQHMRALMQ